MEALATHQLDRSALEVAAPPPPNDLVPDALESIGLEDLRQLMRVVNETTQSLQATHAALHHQVARLQADLAEANAQLRRSRALAALGEMAAGIAHEIRNPLGSIQLYAQMLAEDLAEKPEQARLCGKINDAVGGLDSIVRDVLLFARDMSVKPVETSGDELMTRALSSCDALIISGGVEIQRLEPGREDDTVHADEGLVTQALANIIRNAVEAMIEQAGRARQLLTSVTRRTVLQPDGVRAPHVVFAVNDNGPGIPEAVVERMFNPFFTTRATGTGLGLAIVHRIIDAHGGHIHVASNEGGGATVELRLPIPPAASPAPSGRDPSEAQVALIATADGSASNGKQAKENQP